MKNWVLIIVLVLVAGGLVYYFRYNLQTNSSPGKGDLAGRSETARTSSTASNPLTTAPMGTQSENANSSVEPRTSQPATDGSASTSPLASEQTNSLRPLASDQTNNLSPDVIIDNMRTAIRDYGSRFGGNPVGNNAEITRALDGENPKQVKFLRAETGLKINSKGELVDPWGTPFFFHQLSGSETEIRSAGPDKKLWTADDLVTK